MTAPAATVPLKARIGYGLPAMSLAMLGVPVFVYLPKFYTDVVGVDMATFGMVFLLARGFDAVTDPTVGFLSDRTRSRWGRRRPWIVAGALPLAAAVWMVYSPPASLSAEGSGWWFTGGVLLLFLFWTVVIVPYKSLGPELTRDYDERTSVFAVRETLLVVGTIVGVALPGIIGAVLGIGDSEPGREVFAIHGLIVGPFAVVACIVCAFAVRDVGQRAQAVTAVENPEFKGIRGVFRNKPFVILLAAYTVIAIGGNLPAALLPYFVTYVLGVPEWIPVYLVLYFVVGVSCMPGWVRLGRRWSKKAVWLMAMAINAGAFAPIALLERGDALGYGLLVALSGTAGVAVLVLPSSMQADVIEWDEVHSGQRREGAFMGLWSIAEKMAAAVGVGVALPILDAVGYEPDGPRLDVVADTLRALYVGVPVLCTIVGFAIALRYPIDRHAHAALRERLAGREPRD